MSTIEDTTMAQAGAVPKSGNIGASRVLAAISEIDPEPPRHIQASNSGASTDLAAINKSDQAPPAQPQHSNIGVNKLLAAINKTDQAQPISTESRMGFIIILLDKDDGKVVFYFVESETIPSQHDIRLAIIGQFQGRNVFQMGAKVNGGKYVFTLTPVGGTGATLTYDTINIGTMPTENDLGSARITASTSVDVTSFLKNMSDLIKHSQQLRENNEYNTPVKGFESMHLEFEVRRDNNDRMFELKNVKENEVYASGKFQALIGGARRRARRVVGALTCVATSKVKLPHLKKLGLMPTPDGKERMVYRMGRLHVVRMRPPGCSRTVLVPVRDLKHINTGVRRRR